MKSRAVFITGVGLLYPNDLAISKAVSPLTSRCTTRLRLGCEREYCRWLDQSDEPGVHKSGGRSERILDRDDGGGRLRAGQHRFAHGRTRGVFPRRRTRETVHRILSLG